MSKPVEELSFEEALKELESIVRNLESGSTSLDQSISAYERGALLKKHCETRLAEARNRVEKITLNADGSASTSAMDL